MPAASSEKQYNNFTKGLITEATPLTFPENAILDGDNLVLERTGRLSRRLGMNYESGYSLVASGISPTLLATSRQSFHKWDNPSGDLTVNIGVIRIYNSLWFVNLLESAPSSALLNAGLPLVVPGLANSDLSTSVINNNLVLVSKDIPNPMVLSYNKTTQLVTLENIQVLVRDIWGVDDGTTVDVRLATISNSHKYNLRNQGWSPYIVSTCGAGIDAIDCMKTVNGFYPSNADIWTLGKVGDVSSANFEKFDPASLVKNSVDNASAPEGHFVINAFQRGASRQAQASITPLPVDTEGGRISTITTFASRVFYSGVVSNVAGPDARSPNYSGVVFFTQTCQSKDELGKCYQDADPTSATISDIIDTDGGTIQLPEANQIYKILGTRTSLLVFAQNGVWEIFGDTGGFTATSYQISKISNVGTSNTRAIVEFNGGIVYWSKAGIYVLTQDSVSGRYQAENLSISTIQTLYNNLSALARDNSRGFFDETENRVRWLYNDTDEYSESTYINSYNRELILDLTLQAFYTNTITPIGETGFPFVADYIDIPRYTTAAFLETVFVGNDQVLVSTDEVVINSRLTNARRSQFGFLTLSNASFTISKYTDDTFMDWRAATGDGGLDYSSFLVTGYDIYGDLMRRKQIPYLVVLLEKTEDGFISDGDDLILEHQSSCFVQAQWGWANSDAAGKWGNPFQVYKFKRSYIPSGVDDNFDIGERVIVTKNKLRGSGKALSLKMYSESGKDMRLLGWATTLTGGAKP